MLTELSADKSLSDRQLYQVLGNSVNVRVISSLLRLITTEPH